MGLKQRLIEQITLEGPISVADYMARCLLDPVDGYYSHHVALGADGDFLTAPLVSQMFGEMIGIWVAQTWIAMGSPSFRLVEIGGGDGTLMSDILRVVARVTGMPQATQVVMVEPSAPLRQRQAERLPAAVFLPAIEALDTDRPMIVIANEILDCLPVHQFVKVADAWHERLVGLSGNDLVFGLAREPSQILENKNYTEGDLLEISPAQQGFARTLARTLKSATGAALLIDYGRDKPGCGDTFQALFRHEKQDPLAAPGQHDLTVWADFPIVAATAREAGLSVSAITPQGRFLRTLGIDARLAALCEGHPSQAEKLHRQYARLVAPDQMGDLFKAIAFAWPPSLPLIGLEAMTTEA